MKKIILLLLLFVGGKISAQTFPVTTILYNGPSSNHIDLVFLADGFTSAEQSNFITQVNNICTNLFLTSPYKEYKNLFNVYAIQVNSTQSGIKHPVTASDCASANPSVPASSTVSYFGSTFDYGGIHRLVVATNTTAIQNVLLVNFPAYNKAVVVANSIFYGGSGGTYPCCTINNASSEIMIHEMGHSLANLTDEYTYGGCSTIEKPNCTMETNPT
ncbi:MAG: M64 family metallopeptidase, partial [Bacteroidota bacterium]